MDELTALPPSIHRAIGCLADIRFYQCFWLSPNPVDGRPSPLRVTYADIGDPDGEVLMVCGGLRGIRLITPDKPGIGGMGLVDIDKKVKTWLEIVQGLVRHLHLRHVSFLGHSSGAIYVLNCLIELRHLLHPTRPYAALLAPWIHPSHSGVATSTIASMMPDWTIHKWYDASDLLSHNNIATILGPSTARPELRMETDEMAKAIDEKIMQYDLLENVEGVSQEALFCLKRGGDCGKIELAVFYAAQDQSSGASGLRWLKELWKNEADDWIRYSSSTMPGTTHEFVMRVESGVL